MLDAQLQFRCVTLFNMLTTLCNKYSIISVLPIDEIKTEVFKVIAAFFNVGILILNSDNLCYGGCPGTMVCPAAILAFAH